MSDENRRLNVFVDAASIASPRQSGVGHSLLYTLRALDELPEAMSTVKVTLIAPWRGVEQLQSYRFRNFKIKRVPFPGRVLNMMSRLKVQFPFEALIGIGVYVFPNYRNWKLRKSRSITYIHDICFALFPQYVQPKNLKMLKANVPIWIGRTDKIVTVSESSKAELVKQFKLNDSDVAVVPNGVNTAMFNPRPKQEINTAIKKYHLPQRYILFLSSIEPRKNIPTLLEAYEKMDEGLKDDFGLVIVGGDGWLNEPVHEKVADMQSRGLKVVIPNEYVVDDDLPAVICGAGALVHLAFHEGFSISPLEALACGTPVVASNISPHRELLGDAAIMVGANDAEGAADAIEKVLTDKKLVSKLSKLGLARAHEFSWDQSARELVKVIKSTA
jgi:glycosyltransferase involved in cell wall biosynthesis